MLWCQSDALGPNVDASKNSMHTFQDMVNTLPEELQNFHHTQTRQTVQDLQNRSVVEGWRWLDTSSKIMQETLPRW